MNVEELSGVLSEWPKNYEVVLNVAGIYSPIESITVNDKNETLCLNDD